MLRRVARPISAAVACHAAAAVRAAGTAFSQSVRHMSDDTHDDFKPKVKVNVDDKDEVQKTIEKVRLRAEYDVLRASRLDRHQRPHSL